MLFKNQNLSGVVPSFADGDVVEDCNLSQPVAHTSLGKAKGLIFRRCNLCNCDVPADAKVEGCLTIHVTSQKTVATRTNLDPIIGNQKPLTKDEREETTTEIRTVECGDGSVTRQTVVQGEILDAVKLTKTPTTNTATDANQISPPTKVPPAEDVRVR